MTNKKTYNLFLDDFRFPKNAHDYYPLMIYATEDWEIVRNYDEFTQKIKYEYDVNGTLPKIISFDHDLADIHYGVQDHVDEDYYDLMSVENEKTGFHCAKWLVDFCIDNNLELPEYYAHSMNTVGRKNILGYLDNFVNFSKNQKNG
jgi:hypothetical protein